MNSFAGFGHFHQDLLASFRCESDPGFREEMIRIGTPGMRMAGVVGVLAPLFMFLVSLLVLDRSTSWFYSPELVGTAHTHMVLLDELLLVTLGSIVIALSFSHWGQRHARPIVFVMLVAYAMILYMDFIALGILETRGNLTPLVFLMMIALGTVPFRPMQIAALGVMLSLVMYTMSWQAPHWMGRANPVEVDEKTAFLIMFVVVSTGISVVMYTTRFRQYEARKQASDLNDRLAASERKYRSLFENSAEGIFVIDRQTGRMVTVNPATEEMLGRSAEELYSIPSTEIIHPDDRERVTSYHVARSRGEPAPTRYDLKLISSRSSEPVIAELTIHGTDDPGVTVGAVRDITEHVAADRKLREYAKTLEARNREIHETRAQLLQSEKMASLGNLVAGVAHEINTPLGSIHASADTSRRALDIVSEAAQDDECQPLFDKYPRLKRAVDVLAESNVTTVTAAERIVGIVKSLRSFARLDEAEFKKVDIHEGLESTLTIRHHELKNRVEVVRDFGDLPQVECFPNQLNQVFLNILVNAAQAIGAKGTITIRTRQEGDRAVVEISDTGKGIAPEHLAQIFDPGFTTKGVGVGTGLGLSITYRIIGDHSGRIDVASEVGKGTTFTIRLPIERNGDHA